VPEASLYVLSPSDADRLERPAGPLVTLEELAASLRDLSPREKFFASSDPTEGVATTIFLSVDDSWRTGERRVAQLKRILHLSAREDLCGR
jgi:hypothetical protein